METAYTLQSAEGDDDDGKMYLCGLVLWELHTYCNTAGG